MAQRPLTYSNYTIRECAEAVEPLIKSGKVTVYQKWTCEKCWSRQTMSEANKFFTSGTCENCGHVTDIERDGCNYLLITSA